MQSELTKDEVVFLKNTNANISFCDANPKTKNSKSWHRFEEYKPASTMKEYFALGGNVPDFKYDFSRKFVVIDEGALAGFVQPINSTSHSSVRNKQKQSSQSAEFDEKPKRKRVRGASRPAVTTLPFTGTISHQPIQLVDLNRPNVDELQARCIKPNVPAILRNLGPDGLLSLGSTNSLRSVFAGVLENMVEVAVVDQGNTFYGDESRREATSMRIKDMLDLLDQPTDIPAKDFYLVQCPFLYSTPSTVPPPLAPLALVLEPPSCIPAGGVEGNFWACHRESVTSAHFDGRDNILLVLKGYKEVTMWSPSETRRHVVTSRVGAQQVGMAEVVSNSLKTANVNEGEGVGSLKVVSHVDWPSLSLLPAPSRHKGFRVTVTIYPGEAVFIPEGWYHQVRSEAGTVAVNYWFDGLASKIVEERPHSIPYLLRTLTGDLVEQSRTSLVKACRNQSKVLTQNGVSEFSSINTVSRMITANPTVAVMLLGKHMPVADMFEILPQVVQADSVSMWRALSCATPWAIELLTTTWATGEDSDEAKFYNEFFGAFREEADQVRDYIFRKKEEFGKRLLPLLLQEIDVFKPMSVSSSEMNELNDMTEVRSLLTLLGDHQLFYGAGVDGLRGLP